MVSGADDKLTDTKMKRIFKPELQYNFMEEVKLNKMIFSLSVPR